jgi:hypothetical protein
MTSDVSSNVEGSRRFVDTSVTGVARDASNDTSAFESQ